MFTVITNKRFGRSACKTASAALLLLSMCIYGCVSTPLSVDIQSPYDDGAAKTGEAKIKADAVLQAIEERNRVTEKNPEWVKASYTDFMVKNLRNVDEKDYAAYARYLDKRAVYIIVHPAYYTFFTNNAHSDDAGSQDRTASSNAVDRLIGETSYTNKKKIMQLQEKMLRDFLEFASTERKLVVLILPGGYENYSGYKFKKGNNEFMRYINEISNESESVLYLYSEKPTRGALGEKDMRVLLKFLYEIRADSILIGGGYVGRCLEDFYKSVKLYIGEDKLYVVPELVSISPFDVTSDMASDILKDNGTIDSVRITQGIKLQSLGNQEIAPQIRNLSEPARMSSSGRTQ